MGISAHLPQGLLEIPVGDACSWDAVSGYHENHARPAKVWRRTELGVL